ncbi:Sec-independent protein translocase TatB [Corynebacterium sp. P3-F1]|uniref:Sec-independent protein translocase TatB n=1 Tax=Corynebacterium sp. P3-F1 TaxID=3059080 RepID=UPI003465242B
MFDSIGWGEIFVVILAGLIIIGPERLPGVIMDVRAALFAARRAINDAKEELYGEEFEEFRKPISTVTEYAAMGPKRAIAKALFDEDGDYLDQFDPRRMMNEDPVTGSDAAAAAAAAAAGSDRTSAEGKDGASTGGSTTVPSQTQQSVASSQPSSPTSHSNAGAPDHSSTAGGSSKAEHTGTVGVNGSSEAAVPRPPRRRRRQPGINPPPSEFNPSAQSSGGGFSWADVT